MQIRDPRDGFLIELPSITRDGLIIDTSRELDVWIHNLIDAVLAVERNIDPPGMVSQRTNSGSYQKFIGPIRHFPTDGIRKRLWSTSRFVGVHYIYPTGKWRSSHPIRRAKYTQTVRDGVFLTEIEAALCSDEITIRFNIQRALNYPCNRKSLEREFSPI